MLQARATLWREEIEKYKKEKCGPKGEQEQTISKELLSGIEKLKKRAAKKNEMITVSDKGNDLVMTSLDVYRKQADEQTSKDRPIERREVMENERRLNTALLKNPCHYENGLRLLI